MLFSIPANFCIVLSGGIGLHLGLAYAKISNIMVKETEETMHIKKSKAPFVVLIVIGLSLILAAGWLWYDGNIDRSGWIQKDGVYSYRDFHGRKVTGWLTLGEKIYYFDENNRMLTGWQELEGERYHFGEDGVLTLGFANIDGARYYFDTNGVMTTGWQEAAGRRYYLNPEGAMLFGWQEIDGIRCYFLEDGALAQGWQDIGGSRYYFLDTGMVLTGSAALEDGEYYFREDGSMLTGWYVPEAEAGAAQFSAPEEKRFYYNEQGIKTFGWQEIEGKRYFFDENGVMQTGWHEEGEYRYYLQADGSAAVGPLEIDGQTYYFSPKGIHVVLVNRKNSVPGYYKLDLEIVEDWHRVQKVALEPLRRMLDDCKAAGITYTFNSAYRTLKEQTEILEKRTDEYVAQGMDPDNALAKALKTAAYPGTSEHHLGLAVDLLGEEAIAWFTEHCWDYGFIVRYRAEKEDITGFVDEPWHFRYVGTEVSLDLKDSDLCLEEYLGAAG